MTLTIYTRHALFLTLSVLLSSCGGQITDSSLIRSLTGNDFSGQKYYFGWGVANINDPANMHNEVKYDVLHTHDVFTANVGGNYVGIKEFGQSVTDSFVRSQWREIGAEMTEDDMYVQYSSGHGYPTRLGIGITYDEIRDNALSYPAKEIIIFTMACHSGGLVDSFNRRRSVWEHWQQEGRTLLVMSSSRTRETSDLGPGRDADEPGAPYGHCHEPLCR